MEGTRKRRDGGDKWREERRKEEEIGRDVGEGREEEELA